MMWTTRLVTATMFLVALLCAAPAMAQLDYSADIGTDFDNDFVDLGSGPQPNPDSPQFGANDEWEFITVASDDPPIGGTLTSVPSGLPASGQAGWCAGDGTGCVSPAFYTYFANEGWGATSITLPDPFGVDPWNDGRQGFLGHGPQGVLWTAPASINEGGVQVEIDMVQFFESSRQMAVEVIVNGPNGGTPGLLAVPPDEIDGALTNVNLVFDARVNAGDTIEFHIVPSGLANSPDPTFSAVAITITEANVPEPTSMALIGLGAVAGLLGVGRRR